MSFFWGCQILIAADEVLVDQCLSVGGKYG